MRPPDSPAPTARPAWPWIAACALLIALGGAGLVLWRSAGIGLQSQAVTVLDPARVLVLRTPGGHLEVATLVKVETFGWRSSRTCLWRDCGWLMGQRLGTIEVPVHYTYRIPLAQTWTLRPSGEGYVLSVPAPRPRLPPAVDLAKAQFRSEAGGLLAPDGAANQALLMQNLGPELARRAERSDYLQLQAPMAEQTIREFARRWMGEQLGDRAAPLRIEVRMDADG